MKNTTKQVVISDDAIKEAFLNFIYSLGVIPHQPFDIKFGDGIKRFRVEEDEPSETSGAYVLHNDGYPSGYIQEWRKGIKENFSYPRERMADKQREYWTEEKIKKSIEENKARQKKIEEELDLERANALIHAIDLYNNISHEVPDNFPYLKRKCVTLPKNGGENCSGIHYYKEIKRIYIPLKDVDGEFKSFQWINEKGDKFFETNLTTKGAFYSIDLQKLQYDKENKIPILIGEGVATMLTVYNSLGWQFPIVAAMSCNNYEAVATALKGKYSGRKIIFMADNDAKKEKNVGLLTAQELNKKLNLDGVIFPTFKRNEQGTDWNDYAKIHGIEATRELLEREINFALLPKERQEIMKQVRSTNAYALLHKVFPPMKWAVEGFIPTGLTVLAGNPKVGKSILTLNICSAISLGGCVFGNIPVKQGSALYLALEDTERRLQERLQEQGATEEILMNLELTTVAPRQNEGGLKYIRWWLEEHEDARLVAIDTLQKFRKQLNGKTSIYAEDYDIVSELKSLADEFDVAFLVIHHLKKASEFDWVNEISGSQGIAGAADTIISLKRERNSNGGLLSITGRDVEEKEYEMQLNKFGWAVIGERKEEKYIPTTNGEQKILEYLSTVADTVTAKGLFEYYHADLKDEKEQKKEMGNIRKRLERLTDKGIIAKEKEKDGNGAFYHLAYE